MLSLDECRMALGSLADDKSDDEVARMRDRAAAVARIVIRTYFAISRAVSSADANSRPSETTQDLLAERNDGRRPNRHHGRPRPRPVRRKPIGRVADSPGVRRVRGERVMQS
jgi:hypothetical protein